LLYHLTMIGVFALGYFPPGGSIVLLILMTVAFKLFLDHRFYIPSKFLALENCPSGPKENDISLFSLQNNYIYKHPALRPLHPLEEEATPKHEERARAKDLLDVTEHDP